MIFTVNVQRKTLRRDDMLIKAKEEKVMNHPILIGITGGTGSGKSTIAREIYKQFDEDMYCYD